MLSSKIPQFLTPLLN